MEFVYVVPREELFPDFYPHGLLPFGGDFSRAEFEERALTKGFFVERKRAECTPSWKQIIPYALVVRGDEVLLVRRLNKGGESRLHDKLSIGIGGHINPIDAATPSTPEESAGTPGNLFEAATTRELNEELQIHEDFTARAVGVLNDDSNPVGAVHVGLVQVVQIHETVEIRETDQLEGRLTTTSELRELLRTGANYETWSRLLVESLDELMPKSALTLT